MLHPLHIVALRELRERELLGDSWRLSPLCRHCVPIRFLEQSRFSSSPSHGWDRCSTPCSPCPRSSSLCTSLVKFCNTTLAFVEVVAIPATKAARRCCSSTSASVITRTTASGTAECVATTVGAALVAAITPSVAARRPSSGVAAVPQAEWNCVSVCPPRN